MGRVFEGASDDRETSQHLAIAPAGYVPLEWAALQVAMSADPLVWHDGVSDITGYDRLGLTLHIEDLKREVGSRWLASDAKPRMESRLDSLMRATQRLRKLLRQGHVSAVLQRRYNGQVDKFDPDWWAQPTSPNWFKDGSCFVVDPTMIGTNREIIEAFGMDAAADRGYQADLFVDCTSLDRLVGANSEAPSHQEATSGRPPVKVPAIRLLLREMYPQRKKPYPWDRKGTLKAVIDRLGEVSPSSFDRACKEEWL